ncbi:MFS transporter [Nocardioides cavernae]|uniref:MFS transporter n=1 Tax=Nocardioides cavernae TaxID=1921566 RepID=UPI0015C7C31E|nr:MFS transporter [Nocardioides cavernae]
MVPTSPDAQRSASGWAVALAGMLVIASTYGMARFGVGLLAPRLVEQRPALGDVVGTAASAQFVSYALAAVLAARWGDHAPRTTLAVAGVAATCGSLGVAVATEPATFVGAVFVGGTGAGLASPALVRLVDELVTERARETAHSLVNSGTAAGVAGAGVVAFATVGVATAWGAMAAICAGSAVLLLVLVGRPARGAERSGQRGTPGWWSGGLRVPATAAAVVGAGSALVWSFGPLVAVSDGGVPEERVGWLWIALGLGGLLGPVTGVAVQRLGLRGAWALFVGVAVVAHAFLALAIVLAASWPAYVAMALFGGGYMCLSGVLILWARAVSPDAGGSGTAVLFVALAVGQAVGSAGLDVLRSSYGSGPAVAVAAALALAGAYVGARARRTAAGGAPVTAEAPAREPGPRSRWGE